MSESNKEKPETRNGAAALYAVGQAVYESSASPSPPRVHPPTTRIAAALNLARGIPTDNLEEWSIDYVREPSSDVQANIESILAPASGQDNRGRDRRQKDRRLPLNEIRLDSESLVAEADPDPAAGAADGVGMATASA